MTSSTEDDFWNQSSSSGFNFCEEDDDPLLVQPEVFTSYTQENVTLPIHLVISNKALSIILDDVNTTAEYAVPNPENTIRRIFRGEHFVLNTYRTLDDKLSLLDAAIEVGDGNIILSVVIFMSNTLKTNIFLNHISTRMVAIRHYANYLIEKNDLQELADLYMATGNISNLKDIYYLILRDTSSYQILYKKLEQFNTNHGQNLYSSEDRADLQENLALLDYQLKNNSRNKSIIDELITLCQSEWQKNHGDDAILNFKKQFKIHDFHFDWVVMNVICKMENWDKLVSTFIKSAWVIKKPTLKSAIRPDLFIIGLNRHNPPKDILSQFLTCVGDSTKSLYLAEKFKVHSYIVNYYINQKDKGALLKYLEKIEPGDEAMHTVQAAFNNSMIKWKN